DMELRQRRLGPTVLRCCCDSRPQMHQRAIEFAALPEVNGPIIVRQRILRIQLEGLIAMPPGRYLVTEPPIAPREDLLEPRVLGGIGGQRQGPFGVLSRPAIIPGLLIRPAKL